MFMSIGALVLIGVAMTTPESYREGKLFWKRYERWVLGVPLGLWAALFLLSVIRRL